MTLDKAVSSDSACLVTNGMGKTRILKISVEKLWQKRKKIKDEV